MSSNPITRRRFIQSSVAALSLPLAQTLKRLVVFEGNSITALNPHALPMCWTTLFMQGGTAKRLSLAGVNVAVATDNIVHCTARAPLYVDPLRSLCDVGVLVLWEGTNALIKSGFDGDATFEQHHQYCMNRKQAGWKIVMGTIMNRQYGIPPLVEPRHENARLRFNQLVRANWREWDGILDTGLDDALGKSDSAWNTQYFRDGIHLADAGMQRVADIAEPVIASVFAHEDKFFPLIQN